MRILVGLSVVMIGLAVAPVAAQASPVPAKTDTSAATAVVAKVFNSADPHAAYNALSASDKALFTAAETPGTLSHTGNGAGVGYDAGPAVTPNFSGCWAMQDSFSQKALAGNTLYSGGQSTEVCVSGGSVYYVAVYNIWQSVSTPGWRYDHRDVSTFNAGWEGRGLVQWEFILGAGGWDIQHSYPCLQGRLNANGYSYLWNLSCNLS